MQPPKGGLYRSVIVFCLLLCFSAIKAQKSIHFEDIDFDEAIEKAKSQKKIVFVDVRGVNTNAFTDKVDKDIFTLDSIADFFNAHCISIRVNMGSEEGKKFAPRLAMLMYPVYVFHSSNRDQLDFTNASSITKDPGVLMEKARTSLAIDRLKHANTRSITFTTDSWKNLLGKAKFQNKLIFLDAQTTWCRPCIMMARDIFTLDRVADFYNTNFINVSMDMEKGDGPSLVKKYGIKGYPTFLYIDGDGNLVHSDGGYQEADRFMDNGKAAVTKKTSGSTVIRAARIIPAAPPGAAATPSPAATSSSAVPEPFVTSTNTAAVVPFGDSTFVPATGASSISMTGFVTASASTNATASASTNAAPAADTGMHFTEGAWASLLARAKMSNKLIFVDANTSWCGPCKQMRKDIFPLKDVSQLYNRNFINVDLDMEHGEGNDFRKIYGVRAYPTFLFINGNGEVVHKTVGSCDAAAFRQHALDALSPHRNLLYLQTQYKDHQNDEPFVTTYLAALGDAYETTKADSIAIAFLESRGPSTWQSPSSWILTKEYVNNATSAVFLSLVKDQAAYSRLYAQEEVEKKIYQTYLAWPQHYLHYPEKGKATLDQAPFDEFLRQVKESSYARKEEIAARSRLTVYFGLRDWNNYAATVKDMLSAHIVPMDSKGAEWLFSFADIINRFSGDEKKVLSEAANWAKLISTEITGENPSDKATYLDLYATLLEKTGKTDQALQIRKQINEQQLANAKQNAPFQTLIRIVPKQN